MASIHLGPKGVTNHLPERLGYLTVLPMVRNRRGSADRQKSRGYMCKPLGIFLFVACAAGMIAQETKANKEPGSMVTPVFDATAIDRTADPCVDFYQYACGTWLAKNAIPSDRPEWARFDELEERNLAILRDILEKASVQSRKRTPLEQQIGDYYAACMDEADIEKKGIETIKPELDRIAALANKDALAEEAARLQRDGANVLFSFTSEQDFKNASAMIARADQGGLGLPERDYYVKDDQKSVETRRKYLEHVTKIFELLGDSTERAAAKAQVVMSIETALARASLDVVSRREPANVYHKTPREQLAMLLNPSFAWPKYLTDVNAPAIESLNVAAPEFFKGLDSLINTTSLDDWKTYFTWHLVHSQSPLLPAAFAIPPLISLVVVLKKIPAASQARMTQLAWFGGVALFFPFFAGS